MSRGRDHPPGRVALTNAVTLNGGDAAIARGAIRFLRHACGQGTSVVVFDKNARTASRYHPDLTFRRPIMSPLPTGDRLVDRIHRRVRRRVTPPPSRSSRAALLRSDLVAATGGTYFVDTYGWAGRLVEFETARDAGIPFGFLTQSMGPFRNGDPAIPRLAAVLDGASFVMARDATTVEAVRRIAPDAAVDVAPDMAFALADLVGPVAATARPEPRIAVSVRRWPHFRRTGEGAGMAQYAAGIAAAVTGLVRRLGASVTFVSTCQGIPEYVYDDAEVARQVVTLLDADVASRVEVDAEFRHPIAFVEEIGGFDLLIATRMHASILAWVAGVPTVGISYEFKTDDLYERHGLQPYVTSIEEISGVELVRLAGSVLSASDARAAARARAEGEAAALRARATAMRGLCRGPDPSPARVDRDSS